MSLDIYLVAVRPTVVHSANITHNLGKMARAAGLYEVLWRPEENGFEFAAQLIEPLRDGLQQLLENPEKFKALSPDNGWGTYSHLVKFVRDYLDACIEYPDAQVEVWR